jgi:tRNA(adenine34) deaminase
MRLEVSMDDEFFMRQALVEAKKSLSEGEVPVGAILVSGNRILSRGHNQPITKKDPTAHAEVMAIRKACLKRKEYRLADCDLYVTLEPCAMCLGAAIQARVRRLVFGAYDPKSGAVESLMEFPFDRMNHQPEIKGGVLGDDCAKILSEFFLKKRRPKTKSGEAR